MVGVRSIRTIVVLLLAASLTACGPIGGGPGKRSEKSMVARLRGGAFGDAQVDLVAGVLARAGVGISDGFVQRGAEPVRLTR
jgi:hypothetical protein